MYHTCIECDNNVRFYCNKILANKFHHYYEEVKFFTGIFPSLFLFIFFMQQYIRHGFFDGCEHFFRIVCCRKTSVLVNSVELTASVCQPRNFSGIEFFRFPRIFLLSIEENTICCPFRLDKSYPGPQPYTFL